MSNKKIIGIIILSIFILSGCAGENRGRLIRTVNPSAQELQKNWKDYTVYKLGFRRITALATVAIVYQMKTDTKILLDGRWIAVTTEEEMARSQIWDSTWTRKILAQNDQLYGYLVHRSADLANVKIIDETTVQLFYHYQRTSGR
jgi:hypothetical protein